MTDNTPEQIRESPEVYDTMDAVDEDKFLRKARRVAARLPFVRHAVAMWHSLGDVETPVVAKAVIVGAILYFVMPMDALPDFVTGLGFTDDAAVMAAALKTISTYLKPRHYAKADETLGGR